MNKRIFTISLLSIAFAFQLFCSGFLKVNGTDILTPEGKRYYIQGTNLGNWMNPEGYMFGFRKCNSPRLINEAICQIAGPDYASSFWQKFKDNYITYDDIKFIADCGANTIRIPFHYKLFTNEDYMGLNDENEGFRRIDQVIEWARESGLHVILDMHDAPGGQTGDNIDDSYAYPFLMVSEPSQHKFCEIWKKIAEHYKDEPVVLGYELINEPVATYFKADEDMLNSKLVDLLKRGIKAIRSVDGNHIILVGSPQWNSNFKPFEGVDFGDDNIMFTCHRYGGPATADAIRSYIDFRDASGKPMYMGEIGHNTDEWQADFVKAMKENDIHYTFWPYKKAMNSCMVGYALPEGWDAIVKFTESPRSSYAEVRDSLPDRKAAVASLDAIIENVKFANCIPQTGYIESLTLKTGSMKDMAPAKGKKNKKNRK